MNAVISRNVLSLISGLLCIAAAPVLAQTATCKSTTDHAQISVPDPLYCFELRDGEPWVVTEIIDPDQFATTCPVKVQWSYYTSGDCTKRSDALTDGFFFRVDALGNNKLQLIVINGSGDIVASSTLTALKVKPTSGTRKVTIGYKSVPVAIAGNAKKVTYVVYMANTAKLGQPLMDKYYHVEAFENSGANDKCLGHIPHDDGFKLVSDCAKKPYPTELETNGGAVKTKDGTVSTKESSTGGGYEPPPK